MRRRRPRHQSPLRRDPASWPRLPPEARRALARADSLMADGHFANAARIFDRLSQEAEQRGKPIPAANLALRASQAHFAADEVEAGIERARQAIGLLARARRVDRIPRVLSHVVGLLRKDGHDAQADRLERDIARALEKMGLPLEKPDERRSPSAGR